MCVEGSFVLTEYSEDDKKIHFFSEYKEIFSIDKDAPEARIKDILPVLFCYIYNNGEYEYRTYFPV